MVVGAQMKRILLVLMIVATCVAPVAVAQPEITRQQADEFNRLRTQALDLAERYLIIDGVPTPAPDHGKLERASELLHQALSIAPWHWQSWWVDGKIRQAMGQHDKALVSFRRAYEVEPDLRVVNEMTIEAVRAGDYDFALSETEAGLALYPRSLELRARLAVVHIARNEPDKAIDAAEKALEVAPGDTVTLGIKRLAEDMKAGRVSVEDARELLRQ